MLSRRMPLTIICYTQAQLIYLINLIIVQLAQPNLVFQVMSTGPESLAQHAELLWSKTQPITNWTQIKLH